MIIYIMKITCPHCNRQIVTLFVRYIQYLIHIYFHPLDLRCLDRDLKLEVIDKIDLR